MKDIGFVLFPTFCLMFAVVLWEFAKVSWVATLGGLVFALLIDATLHWYERRRWR